MADNDWDDDGIGDGETYESQSSRGEEYRGSGGPRQAPAPQGMSTGLKVVIGLLITGGVMFLGCIGLVAYFISNSFQFSQDPEDIRAMTVSIVDIEVPEETFPPQGSMMMDMVFFKMKMAIYGEETGINALVIAEGIGAGEIENEMEASMRESIQDQGQSEQINITNSEKRTFTIKGEESEFTFSEGTIQGSDEEVHQVTGGFPGKEGYAFIMIQIEKEKYNEEEIVKMIESIK